MSECFKFAYADADKKIVGGGGGSGERSTVMGLESRVNIIFKNENSIQTNERTSKQATK